MRKYARYKARKRMEALGIHKVSKRMRTLWRAYAKASVGGNEK